MAAYGDILERFGSERATDWVTHSDHVAVIEVRRERELPAPEPEEWGSMPVPREITVEVEDVLWSRPGRSSGDLPESFVMGAPGWFPRENGSKVRAVVRDAVRFEVGHRYVVALTPIDHACDGDGNTSIGDWGEFGTSASIPYDGDVLGQGEFEGRIQDATKVQNPQRQPDALLTQVGGRPLSELVELLSKTEPIRYTEEQQERLKQC